MRRKTPRYPAQIIRIPIRNADISNSWDRRYKTAFKDISRDRWQLFCRFCGNISRRFIEVSLSIIMDR
jgi:hypothetical protein